MSILKYLQNGFRFTPRKESKSALYYLLSAVYIILVFIIVLSLIFDNNAKTQKAYDDSNISFLDVYCNKIEGSLVQLTEIASQLSYNSDILEWINQPQFYNNQINTRKILDNEINLVTSNALVNSIDIYNANSGKIISSLSGLNLIDVPSASSAKASSLITSWIQEDSFESEFLITGDAFQSIGKDNNYISYITTIPKTGSKGIIVVTAQLKDILSFDLGEKSVYLFDKEREILSEINPNDDAIPNTLLSAIIESVPATFQKTLFIQESKAANTNLYSRSIAGTSYSIVLVSSTQSVKTALLAHLPFLCAVLLISSIFVLIGTRVLYYIAYKPLQKVLNQATNSRPSDSIKQVANLVNQYNALQEDFIASLNKNKKYLHDEMIKDIVFGKYQTNINSQNELFRQSGFITVLLFTSNTQSINQIELLISDILDTVLPVESEQIRFTSSVILILNTAEQDIHATLNDIFTANKSLTNMKIGISKTSEQEYQIHSLYEQANLSIRKCEQGGREFQYYEEIPEQEFNSNTWMIVWKIANDLPFQSVDTICDSLDQLYASLSGETYENCLSMISYLIGTAIKICEKEGIPVPSVNLSSPGDHIFSIDEHFNYLKLLIEKYNAEIQNKEKESLTDNVEPVVQYLIQNFNQPLSLSIIADNLGISVSYLSELLKKKLNMNFVSFLRNLRISKAKELLMQDNMKVNDIALAVGYDTVHVFLRNFKQVTGMTPTEYKKHVSADDCSAQNDDESGDS